MSVTDLLHLLRLESEGTLSRIARLYQGNNITVEYKTIPQPTPGTTECLKRSFIYDGNNKIIGEQIKVVTWTSYMDSIVSPPITNIALSNYNIDSGVPSGTKIADILVTGGVAPITLSLTSNPGNLFRIDNATDLVLNAPSVAGTYPIEIEATDDDNKVESQVCNIVVENFLNVKSLQFDGVDERVDFGTAADFRFDRTTPYSISGWFKAGAAATTMHIFGNQLIVGTPRGWSVKLDATKAIIAVLSNTSANQISIKTVNLFTDGLWHSFVVTYDGSGVAAGMKVYVDGVNQALTVTNDTLTLTTVTSATLRAGSSSDAAPSQFYNGNLDELAIWNRSLTLSEVTELYNSGNPTDLLLHSANANLIHYYRMGDGDTFPTISDKKGLSNGTCVNMEALDIKDDSP